MYFLGYDLGSSSIKACLLNGETGEALAAAQYPDSEMPIEAKEAGWAEQHPDMWWDALKAVTGRLLEQVEIDRTAIKAIGITYQMHGLVVVDKNQEVLRPSIIWCDSRAVSIGEKAFQSIGEEKSLSHLLNSPGNFTASKLSWVKANEPEHYEQVAHFMLPGDYLAMRLSGDITTTSTGLSEGIFWDFKENQIASFLLDHYGFSSDLVPNLVPIFGEQGQLLESVAQELGLPAGIPITYRSGDQPNNALSLNVLNPGEVAATAGTSGVIYGTTDQIKYDPHSRVNTFVHVNHTEANPSLGVLLCVNGTGILNAWLKRLVGQYSYNQMNELARQIPIGSGGVTILPFGNGAERVLQNKDIGCQIHGVNFNTHDAGHILRAGQEGIVFALKYGLEVMRETGIDPQIVRAGYANMFQSPIFAQTFSNITNAVVELYETDGAQGAARGAAIGLGTHTETTAFHGLVKKGEVVPEETCQSATKTAYEEWMNVLEKALE